jgi:ribonuclease HI
MGKSKFYVVWKGRTPGIYNNWEDCKAQIEGFPEQVFKSFDTKQLAEEAFNSESGKFIGKYVFESKLTPEQLKSIGSPIRDSIAVDAAWNTKTGVVEFRGVSVETGKEYFHRGPFEDGTINMGEFLAIVLALAYCKSEKLDMPIYSDSQTAISWVRDKEARTGHEPSDRNKQLFDMIDSALKWLKENDYPNKILKWETRAWGENPADFGRK